MHENIGEPLHYEENFDIELTKIVACLLLMFDLVVMNFCEQQK